MTKGEVEVIFSKRREDRIGVVENIIIYFNTSPQLIAIIFDTSNK